MKKLDAAALARRIEERAAADLAAGRISGAAISVSQAGRELYRGALGRQSPEGDAPLRADALFRLASMTKPITAAAMLLLEDRGCLSIDDPVCRYLPAFAHLHVADEGDELDTPVTLRQLLSHSAGYGWAAESNAVTATMNGRERTEVRARADFFARQKLSYRPGTRQEYSATAAFSVLTAVAEEVTGRDFAELLQKEIFEPCGMTDTTFSPTKEQWARMVGMHDCRDGRVMLGNTTEGCVFYSEPPSLRLGGAGLAATLSDYRRFASMLLFGGVAENERRVLSARAVQALQTPVYPYTLDDQGSQWGLGVRVICREGGRLPVGCFGWSGAYGGHFWVDPENGIVAVYLKNSLRDGGSGATTGKRFEEDVVASLI